ncbi:MAG: MFS transporter [Deltaproteobacteria bacterium]|jgi:EmrB/QacA subfamily drug resistance transporter|nr:MFS transporter [Deltaproteobacteria bacterium]
MFHFIRPNGVNQTSLAINYDQQDSQISPVLPWIVAVTTFMQAVDGSILHNAIPSIAKALAVDPLKMRWVVVAYLLTTALFIPVSGWLADKFGVRRIFCLAIVVFSLGSLCCALSRSLTYLVASRVLQGIGGALMVPVGRLAVVKIYGHSGELIKVLSFISLPAIMGPVFGPIVGGFFVQYVSWYWIFLINIPVGVCAFFMTFKHMPDLRELEINKFDFWGFGFFSVSIAILSLWLVIAPDSGLIKNLDALIIGLALMSIYWLLLAKRPGAIFQVAILKKPGFLVGILGSMCSRMGTGAMPFMVPMFLQLSLGFSPIRAGLFLLAQATGSFTGKNLINIFLPKIGYKNFLQINTIFLGLIVCSFSIISSNISNYYLIIILFIYGTINSMQFTAMNSYILIDLDHQEAGTGNSLLSVVIQICSNSGVAMAAGLLTLFARLSDKVSFQPSVSNAPIFGLTFIIIGLIILCASLVMRKIPKDADTAKNNQMTHWG